MARPRISPSPVSVWSQRWAHGRHTWRHPADGGFNPANFEVVELDEATARGFVTRHHYSGTYPASRKAYGLVTTDDRLAVDPASVDGRALVGVAVLSVPMRSSVVTNVFPDLEPYVESLELGRFVLTDTPANAESWMLSRVWSRAAEAGVRGVVSFADPMPRHREVLDVSPTTQVQRRVEVITPGHVGVVYQALNARACGRSTARTIAYLPRHGVVLSARMLSKVRAQESGSEAAERRLVAMGAQARRAGQDPRAWLKQALVDLNVVRVRHPGNFRYAWPLGDRRARRLVRIAPTPTSYPKADRDLLPAVLAGHSEKGVLW
jgi:hypothetical protein